MICVAMQPTYLPWMGYFDLMDQADLFLFLDDVQLARRSWQTRNRILGPNGVIVLSIPVKKTAHRDDTFLNSAVLDEGTWRRGHLASLRSAYGRTPFFREVFPVLEEIISTRAASLASFNMACVETLARRMGITTRLVAASNLPPCPEHKDRMLARRCLDLGADVYLSPPGAGGYIEAADNGRSFLDQGVALRFQQYVHPTYPRLRGGFISHMSVVDALMHVGFRQARDLVVSGRRPPLTPEAFYRSNETVP